MSKQMLRFCRWLVRVLDKRHYEICRKQAPVTPAVYVVHHQNLRGPVRTIAWFDVPVRPWVLNVFCQPKACFHQYYNYTFSRRFGMPRPIALVLAFVLSYLIAGLMKVIRAIPVHRDSKQIVDTFKESLTALAQGENLLISPDRDYTDSSSTMGAMYDGFLNLEKYYRKQTGQSLNFLPLHLGEECIYVGDAISFDVAADFKQEKAAVYARLMQEFSRLEAEADETHS